MTNLVKLEFLALDISGQNYMSRVLDAEIYLTANGLGETIQACKETTVEQKAKTIIFLRHHLHGNLKFEYLTIKDPPVLWNHLKDKYEHKKTVILPRARYELVHLRGFEKYCDLISCLLVAEKNNELLMKNHKSRPTGSAPFSEANVVTYNQSKGHARGSDHGRGRGRGRGHGQWRGFGRCNYHGYQFGNTSGHKKWQTKAK
nr:hypothetical protein [Tanacetum cinerariifolium]